MEKSLLQKITSQEIDDLLFEYQLEEAGYKFHYFIDNYDISKYTFPFGLLDTDDFDDRQDRQVEVITDEQIAYDFLINHWRESLLLFNEHKEEVDDFIEKIKMIEFAGMKTVNSFEKQAEHFKEVSQGKPILSESLQEISSKINVSLLISIALGSFTDSKKKLESLKKNKLCYNIENNAENIPDNIKEILLECKPNEDADKIYEKLILSYEPEISLRRLLARYKKCLVFNKLLLLNNKAKSLKHLFILVSSGKATNERLPQLADELELNISIDGKKFNPIRSIQQIYLQLLLQKSVNKQKELLQIKNYISLKEQNNSPFIKKTVDDIVLIINKEKISALSNSYENSALLLNNYYRDIFDKSLKTELLQKENYQDIATWISKLLEISKKTNALEELKATTLSKFEFVNDCNEKIKNAIKQIDRGEETLGAYSGYDYVENIYHCIPYVFFKSEDNDFQQIISKIVELITTLNIRPSVKSRQLIDSINKSNFNLFYKPLPNEGEKIIMLILSLMLKKSGNISDFDDPNNLAYERVSDILKKNSISDGWESDFMYIKAWIGRRIRKFEESIEISKKEIKKKPLDPRFYHSLCLNYYCLYRENEEIITNLEQSIENCEKAYKIYLEKEEKENGLAIQTVIIALLNSLSYLKTIYFTKNKNYDDIFSARNYLYKLKYRDSNYLNIAEFAHTEALLCLQDYYVFGSDDMLKQSKEAIERAMYLNPKKKYFDLKNEITELYQKTKH